MRLMLLEGTHRSCDERKGPHGRLRRNTDESMICGGRWRGVDGTVTTYNIVTLSDDKTKPVGKM